MRKSWQNRTENKSTAVLIRRSIVSFTVFLVFVFGCFYVWKTIKASPKDSGAYKPLRSVLNANEKLFASNVSDDKLTKEYPVSAAAKRVRANGYDGLRNAADTANWHLNVVRSPGDTLHIGLDEIKALPKKDIIFDFKCIEGWSQVTHWAGVPMKTFIEHYHLEKQAAADYFGLETPDHQYYVGIDRKSALHPQTILCYEMNGEPLPMSQGYPLRLIIPVKYGVKHLKRIGTMFFSQTKPRDYWAERGYDYFAGL